MQLWCRWAICSRTSNGQSPKSMPPRFFRVGKVQIFMNIFFDSQPGLKCFRAWWFRCYMSEVVFHSLSKSGSILGCWMMTRTNWLFWKHFSRNLNKVPPLCNPLIELTPKIQYLDFSRNRPPCTWTPHLCGESYISPYGATKMMMSHDCPSRCAGRV